MNKKEFPIQVVEIRKRDHKPPGKINSQQKVFGDITSETRQRLCKQLDVAREHFSEQFARWPALPAVAKVTLKEEALAKSHRPTALLTNTTCPIVGTLDYGELLISATNDGFNRLSARIKKTTGKKAQANITAIDRIEPYLLNDWDTKATDGEINKWIECGFELKLRLFDHKNKQVNESIRASLLELAKQTNINLEEINYGEKITIFKTKIGQKADAGKTLQSFVGLRSLTPMPSFMPSDFNIMASPMGPANELLLPPPDDDVDYPVVGVIDSGVCPDCKLLQPWVVAQEQYAPVEDQDNTHGTMVAGLIAGAHSLNHEDERFPRSQAKFIDVQVFEKDVPLAENTLVAIIEEVIPKYPNVRVWNLSLGGDSPAKTEQFSDFACFLDEMHDRYGCLFVVASGNHELLQSWPQTKNFAGLDRVSSPGDSVRALTVGSIANSHKDNSLCKTEEPSPFSRRGPGPCHIPKPEVSHYGGNCAVNMTYAQTGILSVGPSDVHMESLGTSFSTPLVGAQAASIWNYLSGDPTLCTAERVKALLIHSALLGTNCVTKETLNHSGFGRPGDTIDVLYCDPNSITLLFETELKYGGYEFERWPIPIADSLTTDDGKFRGEIFMTLVYSPIVDRSFASEYCRTNVDVGMGKYDKTELEEGDVSYEFNSVVPLAPKDVKDLFEKEQIEHGFKWSPVKAYHAVFPRGKTVEMWRLRMKATRRAELLLPDAPQRATLLVTLKASEAEAEVYNESIRMLNQEGWTTTSIDSDIQIELGQPV